jgi:hypothetical protein
MKTTSKFILTTLIGLQLVACSSVQRSAQNEPATATRPPLAVPSKNITDFSDALRCMDESFVRYGTRDVSIIAEDFADTTKKVSAGTRDMMISAISDMTRRSRAIQLVTFGQDANNIVAFLNAAQKRTPFATVPQYDLRGSISQLDENVIRSQSDSGISLESLFSIGRSKSRQFSVLGLDMSVAHTATLALVPGISSRNVTVIAKDSEALDGEATIRKIGVNFSTSFQRTDGTAQALRNMVELAAVEIFGRLTRQPYWTCLGVGPENSQVKREIEDWFIGMDRAGELVPFFQEQLRNRGFYEGPIDGQATPALRQAISAYRQASNAGNSDLVDLPFFTDFLHKPFPTPPVRAFSPDPIATAPTSAIALRLEKIGTSTSETGVRLRLASNTPTYAYCYSEAGDGKFQRIFPNRQQRDARLSARKAIDLLPQATDGRSVTCFAAPRELYIDMPAALRWGDFQNLNAMKSVDDIGRVLSAVAKMPVGRVSLQLAKK